MSTFDQMVEFLHDSWRARKYIVPCLVGPAGIGKTAAVNLHAKQVKAKHLVIIIASQILPNEVSGITMPVAETKAMEIYDHYKLSQLEDGDILFFDELLEADQLVLSACLTLIESRQLMSGKKLPDIQIIAATNPTIKPNMLKENIRQRFAWRKFDIDPKGCRRYIKETYGFDVGLELSQLIVDTGNEYNILTPRSLTKMAAWMSEADGDMDVAAAIARQINSMWNNTLGTKLRERYQHEMLKPEIQFKNTLRNVLTELNVVNAVHIDQRHQDVQRLVYDDNAFEETSMIELMDLLTKLPEWDQIQQMLSMLTIEDGASDDAIEF